MDPTSRINEFPIYRDVFGFRIRDFAEKHPKNAKPKTTLYTAGVIKPSKKKPKKVVEEEKPKESNVAFLDGPAIENFEEIKIVVPTGLEDLEKTSLLLKEKKDEFLKVMGY